MANISMSTLHYMSFLGYPDLWNGDTADGTASASSALQAAIDNCDGVLDLKPGAIYLITAPLNLKSGLALRGNGCTFGNTSQMTFIFNENETLANVSVDGITFDGTATWPEDTTVDRDTVSGTNGIVLDAVVLTNFRVTNCAFTKLSGSSVRIVGKGSNVYIGHNRLEDGFYTGKAIAVYGTTPPTQSEMFGGVLIEYNTITRGGVTAFVNAADIGYLSSNDAIHTDACYDSFVDNNAIYDVAGTGIRIEDSNDISVKTNRVDGAGGDGIMVYKNGWNVVVAGNIVRGWGRLPFAASILDYSGTLVIPRETPHTSLAPFPADPTASSWWEEWPYTLDGIDEETIQDWDDRAYYSEGPPESGILAFRGHSGISISQSTKDCVIKGNICIPDLTTDEGKYTHASDFGISIIHYFNHPVDTSALFLAVISVNIARGRVADVYLPEYQDPINERGESGDTIAASNAGS